MSRLSICTLIVHSLDPDKSATTMSMQLASLSDSKPSTFRLRSRNQSINRVVWLCCSFAMLTAIFPVARACFRVEVSYNEGWNIYNTVALVNHQQLYPVRYGWKTVNYPMLSFEILAQLHRVTQEYLFTARALSLVGLAGTSFLIGAIVRILGSSRQAAMLAGFYCLALFTTDADIYVGVDDPQMFAQIFFLTGLLVYLWRRYSLLAVAAAALFFVVGGSIKHNQIDIPLTVLIDLFLLTPRRALWFTMSGLGLAWASVALNIHFGGPYFLAQTLLPRSWTITKAADNLVNVLGPILAPFMAATYMAFLLRKEKHLRIASLLLVTSVLLGGFFGGGGGVSINSLFSALLAVAILTGLFFQQLWKSDLIHNQNEASDEDLDNGILQQNWPKSPYLANEIKPNTFSWQFLAPLFFFAWLIIPWLLVPAINSGFNRRQWDPVLRLQETVAAQKRFDDETTMLRSLQGPAICESLLRCYFAGKPYTFDPFNSTRLIRFGKLDPSPVINNLDHRYYAAVQFDDDPVQKERSSERFDPAIEAAIEENYVPALANEDGEIYVPRSAPH